MHNMIDNVDIRATPAAKETAPFTSNVFAMSAITTLFFMWGTITVLNDIVIPHLKSIFDLNYKEAMCVQFCFFSAYFVFAAPFGLLVEKIGYQKTIVTGLLIAAAGALLIIPSAQVARFPFFLGAYIVLAAGITAMQVSANSYISVLGDPRTGSARLNLAGALNSLGTTIGPIIGGYLIFSAAAVKTPAALALLTKTARQAYRVQQASSVILPYLVIGGALILIAIAIGSIKLPRISEAQPDLEQPKKENDSIWHYPHAVLGAVAIFFYVGAEVTIGSFLVNYCELYKIGGFSAEHAAKMVSFYWGGAMIGRFAGSVALRKVSDGVALGWATIAAALLTIGSILSSGHLAMVLILMVGLFNSIMFPDIFNLGIAKMGHLTGKASGLMIAAIVGGAIIPVIQGALADRIGLQPAFIVPVFCYAYLCHYGFKGSKPYRLKEAL